MFSQISRQVVQLTYINKIPLACNHLAVNEIPKYVGHYFFKRYITPI